MARVGQVWAGAVAEGPCGAHPERCSGCGHGEARRGARVHQRCGSGSSPPSGSTGPGLSQSPWTCGGLGQEARLRPLLAPGLPLGATAAGHAAPPLGGHTSSPTPRRAAPGAALPSPAHGSWARSRRNCPHSRPPGRTAAGPPRRPCSGTGVAPGGSEPGGLRRGRAASSPRHKILGTRAAGRGSSPSKPGVSRQRLLLTHCPPGVCPSRGVLLGSPQPEKAMSSNVTAPLWVAFRVAEKVTWKEQGP